MNSFGGGEFSGGFESNGGECGRFGNDDAPDTSVAKVNSFGGKGGFGGVEPNGFGSRGGFGGSDRTNGTEGFGRKTVNSCDTEWGYGQMKSFGGGEFSDGGGWGHAGGGGGFGSECRPGFGNISENGYSTSGFGSNGGERGWFGKEYSPWYA